MMMQQKNSRKRKSDVSLIVCPDYWGHTPSLAIATLAGVLKKAQYEVTIADINIRFQRRYNIYQDSFSKMMDNMWNPLETIRLRKDILQHLVTGRDLESLPEDIKKHNAYQQLFLRYNFFKKYCLDEVAAGSELFGFSIITENLLCTMAVINLLKSHCPEAKILVGGPECHPLNATEVLKLSPNIDMICESDGEIAVLNYMNSINGKGAEESGYMMQVNGAWADYGQRKLTGEEFGKLGIMPDFSEFPLHLYLEPGAFPIATSRGCTGKCMFCSERLLHAPYRRTNPHSLRQMLTHIRKEYSPSRIRFADSLLNGSKTVFTAFLKTLEGIDWKIPWEGNVRADNIDAEHFELLRETNCRRIRCGIESMVPKTLCDMKKQVRLTNIEYTIEKAHDNGIKVHGYLILGFPGEKTEDYMKTLPSLFGMDSLHPHVISWRYLPSEDQDAIYRKFALQRSLDFEEFFDRENDPPQIADYILKNHLRSDFFTDENGYDYYDRRLRQIYSMQLLKMTGREIRNTPEVSLDFIKKYDWLPFRVVKARPDENEFLFYGKKIAAKNDLENDILLSMDGRHTVRQIVRQLVVDQTNEDRAYSAIYDILNAIL